MTMRTARVPTPLQQLLRACRNAFKGPGTVPSPRHVQKLRRILDNMRPEDVGLSSDLRFPTPRVTYTTIYECNKFSLCCFFIPANGVIPLHNHPDMTVFSKLLLGKMHIKSYDWVDPVNSDGSTPAPQLRLAELKADSVSTASCKASVLYPTKGGNIHAFTAVTPCAVLDVMGPPYSIEDGRDCTYYKDHPYAAYSKSKPEADLWRREKRRRNSISFVCQSLRFSGTSETADCWIQRVAHKTLGFSEAIGRDLEKQ